MATVLSPHMRMARALAPGILIGINKDFPPKIKNPILNKEWQLFDKDAEDTTMARLNVYLAGKDFSLCRDFIVWIQSVFMSRSGQGLILVVAKKAKTTYFIASKEVFCSDECLSGLDIYNAIHFTVPFWNILECSICGPQLQLHARPSRSHENSFFLKIGGIISGHISRPSNLVHSL